MKLNKIEKELRRLYPYGHPDFIPMCLEEIALHSAKNKDYAYGGDPLGNFKRVSQILNCYGIAPKPEVVALMYAFKQLDAILNMLFLGYEGEVESLQEKLRDVCVYLKIIGILSKESR